MLALRARDTRIALALLAIVAFAGGCATQHSSATLDDGARAYREGRVGDAELIWLEALSDSAAFGE